MTKVKKDSIVEDFHGTKVSDPYRWLENPDSTDSIEWSNQLGKECADYFTTAPSQHTDKEKLEALFHYTKHFVPEKVKGTLFYQRNEGLQNQAVLYKEKNGQESIVIDPNRLSEDGTVAMTNYAISYSGQYISFATSTHGSDWQEIHAIDVANNEKLEDHIQHVKFSSIAWSPDDSGFYYSRFPGPGTVSPEDESNFNTVYFHKLGTKQQDDILVHEQPEDKELMFSAFISDDKKYIGLYVNEGTATENRIYIKPINSEDAFIKFLDQQDAEYSYITNEGSLFYFQTNHLAPMGRVVAIDINAPQKENWKEVISEQQGVLEYVVALNETLVVAVQQDAHHQLHLFSKDGVYKHEIELPILGSLTDISRNKEEDIIYFGLTSFLNPTTVYSYHVGNNELDVIVESEMTVDTDPFKTVQVFYPSKDGTKVPMFLTYRKDLELNGQNPVLLYGYGGFNVSMTPSFNPAVLRWLEKGGVYAVANLRGGTEYGEAWHKAGMLENKQNVFDDFIAAGEWLITNNYTRKEKLSIMGGSNGGLLVAACMVQRPDLFGAVICRVPVIDMLRYHKFTIGRYWIPEYGSADNAEHFPFLYAYSPLHNVEAGIKYPPLLIATAESDDRVVPAHAKKFAATLKEKAHEDSTIVLRLESKAGHGLGKPTSKIIEEWVDFYAFLDKELK
ncbi:prolyl oligopeptidase family serine peptidase [Oceanobacillus picturae]|uniref:prolyl oligopeptidase family serine peptidase n=1 Tax=Oceanobacillus picturae TaxID=171693 RepID=UPI000E687F3F|nr:prolyl oligopeptidase family serine peptidase [Oceanobacillus picturae]RIU91932.1 S9 family peptidase [Oceanobacillus picturae]